MNPSLFKFNTTGNLYLKHTIQYQSVILSAVIADALGRIGSEYETGEILICRSGWCSQGPFSFDDRGNPLIFNGTYREYWSLLESGSAPQLSFPDRSVKPSSSFWVDRSNDPIMYSFPQPLDYRERWTEISLYINRYGYGWGVKGKLVKAAMWVLGVHAVIIIVHCCHLIISAQYFNYMGSLGELMVLALESPPPPPSSLYRPLDPKRTSRKAYRSAWSRRTAVRYAPQSQDPERQLEIVLSSDRTPDRSNKSSQSLLSSKAEDSK